MDNYIVINGKKVELTQEQLKQLGISVEVEKETPFARHSDEVYWSINVMNVVIEQHDRNDDIDNALYENINYFNDYDFAQQVALQQLLYRKLLKYAYENDAIVTDWTDHDSKKYFIMKSMKMDALEIAWHYATKDACVVYFTTKEVAERAIVDVVKPFMKEHPEFVW